jgi:hypothetical protein
MNSLNVWKFALASAVAFAVLSGLCAVAVLISRDATIAVFNSWFHGLDLRLLVPPGGRAVTVGQVISGVVSAALVAFVAGAMVAASYNFFNRGATR